MSLCEYTTCSVRPKRPKIEKGWTEQNSLKEIRFKLHSKLPKTDCLFDCILMQSHATLCVTKTKARAETTTDLALDASFYLRGGAEVTQLKAKQARKTAGG